MLAQNTRPWLYVVGADDASRLRTVRSLALQQDEWQPYEDLAQLPPDADRAPSVILLLPPTEPWRTSIRTLSQFRSRDVATPLVLYAASGQNELQHLSRYARAGLDDVLLGAPGADGGARRALRLRAEVALPGPLVMQLLSGSATHHPAVGYCVRNAFRPLRVSAVAAWFGCTGETLNRALHGAGLPSLRCVIRVSRLLYVAAQLDRGSTRTSAARALGFDTPRHLTMFVRRVAGVAPRRLLAMDALASAAALAAEKLMSD